MDAGIAGRFDVRTLGAGPVLVVPDAQERLVLEELVRRVRTFEVHGERSRRVHSVSVRGFAALPVTVTLR